MKGNIYCDQHCPICGGPLAYDYGRGQCACREHPDHIATGLFRVKYGRKIERRFTSIRAAERFLTGIRFQDDQGTLDPRDYQFDAPLAFDKMATAWLDAKAKTVSPGTMKPYRATMRRAMAAWGDRNIKTISYGDLEDLFLATRETHASKTVHNDKTCLETFWKWCNRRENVKMPAFPDVKYTLGWRQIIDLETQAAILDKVTEIAPFRVALAIRWLAVYVAIRPAEMRSLREADVDVDGLLVVRPQTSKERKPKLVPLMDDDLELVRALPPVLDKTMPFFRHERVHGTARPGDPLSHNVLWRWWRKACEALGIESVDLYGGTRHSSLTALGAHFNKEEIRQNCSLHSTNKALERYVQGEAKPMNRLTDNLKQLQAEKRVIRMPDVGQKASNLLK